MVNPICFLVNSRVRKPTQRPDVQKYTACRIRPKTLNPISSEPFDRHMFNDNDRFTRAELDAANRKLKAGLQKCEELVADCRAKLRAANDPEAATEEKQPQQA